MTEMHESPPQCHQTARSRHRWHGSHAWKLEMQQRRGHGPSERKGGRVPSSRTPPARPPAHGAPQRGARPARGPGTQRTWAALPDQLSSTGRKLQGLALCLGSFWSSRPGRNVLKT